MLSLLKLGQKHTPVVPSKTIPNSRTKWAKCISIFSPKRRINPTRWGRTYLCGLYKGVPPRFATQCACCLTQQTLMEVNKGHAKPLFSYPFHVATLIAIPGSRLSIPSPQATQDSPQLTGSYQLSFHILGNLPVRPVIFSFHGY